jgi:hypothetical protein
MVRWQTGNDDANFCQNKRFDHAEQARVAHPQPDLAADQALVAADQLGRGLLVAPPDALQELGKALDVGRGPTLPIVGGARRFLGASRSVSVVSPGAAAQPDNFRPVPQPQGRTAVLPFVNDCKKMCCVVFGPATDCNSLDRAERDLRATTGAERNSLPL